MSPQAAGSVHSHPTLPGFSDKPSKNDIEVAKQTKKNVWVVSSSGLWNVDPSGEVSNVYQSPTWFKDKEPK
jgi:hypothetical protein